MESSNRFKQSKYSGTEVVGCEDKTICQGESVPLTVTTGVSYLYTPSTGLSDPTSPTPIASPTQTTTYTVQVTDANGCTGSDQITVFVQGESSANAGPDQTVCACSNRDDVVIFVTNGGVTVNAGVDQSLCEGGSAQLNATGGTNYSWSPTTGLSNPNIANPLANPTQTTTYTVTSTNASGCSGTDQVTVFVGNGLTVSPVIEGSSCCGNDGSIYLPVVGSTGSLTYSWTPNVSNSNTARNLDAGTYNITVVDFVYQLDWMRLVTIKFPYLDKLSFQITDVILKT